MITLPILVLTKVGGDASLVPKSKRVRDKFALSFVVLRSNDPKQLRKFYEAIGLRFKVEKHGRGPTHYAASVGAVVLELYPTKSSRYGGATIGLRVSSISTIRRRLIKSGHVRSLIPGREDALHDPDGNYILLTDGALGLQDHSY
jgi:hypothetical protein